MNKEIKNMIEPIPNWEFTYRYDGSRTCGKSYIQSLLDEKDKQIKDLQQKVEQLENIRKEAIKATKDVKQFVYDELVDRNVSGATETHCKIMDLLNILNKGSDK